MSTPYETSWADSPHAIIDPSLAVLPVPLITSFQKTTAITNSLYRTYGDTSYARHINRSNAQILSASCASIARAPLREPLRALILGAGACNDIPLEKLADTYDHTTIVDIDPQGTAQEIAKLPAHLLGRVSLVGADITGILGRFTGPLDQLADTHQSYEDFAAAVTSHIQALPPAGTLPDLGSGYAFVSSHLVMSQLISGPANILNAGILEAYGRPLPTTIPETSEDPLITAVGDLQTGIQNAHIAYLRRLVGDSGVVHFADATTNVRRRHGEYRRFPLIDQEVLQAIIDEQFTTEHSSKWVWRASPPFSVFEIEAMQLLPRPAA